MIILGIWTENGGGFCAGPFHSRPEADEHLTHLLEVSEDVEADRADLSVIEMCPDHDEQPKDDCEECDTC